MKKILIMRCALWLVTALSGGIIWMRTLGNAMDQLAAMGSLYALIPWAIMVASLHIALDQLAKLESLPDVTTDPAAVPANRRQ